MFSRKESSAASNFDVIIGKNSRINGRIESEGSVRIDGHLSGDIKCEGDVLIGTDAKVEGAIEAFGIEISGEVEGNVTAKGAFRIYETGMLFGDINVSSFAIDEGGVFEGMCHINTKGIGKKAHNRDKDKQKPMDFDLDMPFDMPKDDKESKQQTNKDKSNNKK